MSGINRFISMIALGMTPSCRRVYPFEDLATSDQTSLHGFSQQCFGLLSDSDLVQAWRRSTPRVIPSASRQPLEFGK
jgi:hypothetical protein